MAVWTRETNNGVSYVIQPFLQLPITSLVSSSCLRTHVQKPTEFNLRDLKLCKDLNNEGLHTSLFSCFVLGKWRLLLITIKKNHDVTNCSSCYAKQFFFQYFYMN